LPRKPQAVSGGEVLGGDAVELGHIAIGKVGADEAPAQQGGRAKYALLAAADGGTPRLWRMADGELGTSRFPRDPPTQWRL